MESGRPRWPADGRCDYKDRPSGERIESFKLGVHHGVFCVGCCWSLMLLMFIVGMGNVAWMLLLGAVIGFVVGNIFGRRQERGSRSRVRF